ncbi:Gfo/Idh/MocA family oxidoreductase [Tessaracoccus sp. MC1865]|uniref:Gfo/Idh/MocA family protein n=1 Tax=Tessaracoccus sp. MC1865 TaxID=2760310 RepID=UPI0016022B2E|nr:Gfo/Idh/MocA family oxidoreductase [Tessaracoccus sp. MC1865]QTO38156.1 Gfo/Idh/MocA family oxidoreductase [Tessaracoccus sp. MC1865]
MTASDRMMPDSQFAMVGCGARAVIGRHINELNPGAAITHAVDPTEQGLRRARDLFGDSVATFASTEDLLAAAPPLAGAVVCTPDGTHAEVAGKLLRAGVPVYLEKPMAVTLAHADALLEAAAQSGTKLYVGHNMRHMAVVRMMKEIIDDGLIGAVKAVWCRHFVGHGGDYYFKDWHAEREQSGTLLLQKGAHDLDIIHYLAGASSELVQGLGALVVYGDVTDRRDNSGRIMPDWFSHDNWPPRAQTALNPVIDVEDISMVQMRLSNGVLASYQQCHFTPDYWRNYTVIGDAGRLENFGDGEGGVVRVWNRRHDYAPEGDLEFPIVGDKGGHEDADLLTMAEFLRFLDGADTVTSALAARDAVATAVTGAASLRAGGGALLVPQAGGGA